MKLSNFLNSSCLILFFSLTGQLIHAMESKSINSTALFEAIEDGSVKRVEQLLGQGIDLRAVNQSGATALHVAALLGEDTICSKLIAAGSVVNARNNAGNTPLHIAARKGHASTCSILISLGAKLNARNDDDETPLNMAQKAGKLDLVGILSGQGSSAGNSNQGFQQAPPLYSPQPAPHFVQSSHTVAPTKNVPQKAPVPSAPPADFPVEKFKQMGIERRVQPIIRYELPNTSNEGVVTGNNNEKLFKLLSKWHTYTGWGEQFNPDLLKKIMTLIKKGKYDLEANGKSGNTLFMEAVNQTRLNSYMVTKQVSTNSYKTCNMSIDAINASFSFLSFLLENGGVKNLNECFGSSGYGKRYNGILNFVINSGNTQMHPWYVQKIAIPLTKLLIKRGAKSNIVNPEGNTILFELAPFANLADTELIQLLIESGAELNREGSVDKGKHTSFPLFTCARTNKNWFKSMVEAGADVNVVTKGGDSILIAVARNPVDLIKSRSDSKSIETAIEDSSDMISGLVPLVNNINQVNESNFCALSLVCLWNPINIRIVKLLLQHGADPSLILPSIYVFLPEDVKSLFEKSHSQGIRQAFGTRDQQEAKRKILEEQILRAQAQAKAQAQAITPATTAGRTSTQNGNQYLDNVASAINFVGADNVGNLLGGLLDMIF